MAGLDFTAEQRHQGPTLILVLTELLFYPQSCFLLVSKGLLQPQISCLPSREQKGRQGEAVAMSVPFIRKEKFYRSQVTSVSFSGPLAARRMYLSGLNGSSLLIRQRAGMGVAK